MTGMMIWHMAAVETSASCEFIVAQQVTILWKDTDMFIYTYGTVQWQQKSILLWKNIYIVCPRLANTDSCYKTPVAIE